MALVAGVLRRFLLDRDELPDSTLVAMVPVSVHDKSDRPGRNQVSGMFSSLDTDIEDPGERLKAIADANSVAKQHSSAIGATLLQDWSQFAAPAVFGVAMRVYASSRLTERRARCTTWSSPTCRARRCRCTSWAPRSRRCIRSGRSSTAPG